MADLKAIQQAMLALEKRYKDSSELFPDFTTIKQIDVIPSRSAIINAVTGVGGFPRARVTEIFGPESSGKTTTAIDTAASAQMIDPEATALFVDFEHAFDAGYAHSLGLDLNQDRLVFAQPDYFEQGQEIIETFIKAGLVDMVVVDSAAAMTPKAILEGSAEDSQRIGLQSSLMSNFLGKATKLITRGRRPALIILNQTRANIDIANPRNSGGDKPAGGNALKFYASIILQLEIIKKEGEANRGQKGTDQVYTQNRVRITCIKNKVAPPWIRGALVMEFGKGINNVASVAELAEAKLGIMSGAGFFKYKGDRDETSFSCRGRDAFIDLLNTTPNLLTEMTEKVLQSIRTEQATILGVRSIVKGGAAKVIESLDELPSKAGSETGMLVVEELD